MDGGETGVGESPATIGGFHSIGPGGIPMKKKVYPKASPKKLTEKKTWKKSFNKFASKKFGGQRGK